MSFSCTDDTHVDEHGFEIFYVSATIGNRSWTAIPSQSYGSIYQDMSPIQFEIVGQSNGPDTASLFELFFLAFDSMHYEAPITEGVATFIENVSGNLAYLTNKPSIGNIHVDSLSKWDINNQTFYIRGRFNFILINEISNDSLSVTNGVFEVHRK